MMYNNTRIHWIKNTINVQMKSTQGENEKVNTEVVNMLVQTGKAKLGDKEEMKKGKFDVNDVN